MEEKKENKKLTYEQLNDACNQLLQQNQQLAGRNRELESFVMFKRLDYLFKVLEHTTMFPNAFLISCANEIKEALTVPEESKEED
jgi:hypothetical protein